MLKIFMLQGSQSTGKCTTLKRSYILKSTSYLGLAVSAVGPRIGLPHSCSRLLVKTAGWHNQPHFTLLPPMQHHRPPTHSYLDRHWCTGARNAMNLVGRKSKVREKNDLGAWGRRQAQPGDLGRMSGCFFHIKEIREKTDFTGGGGGGGGGCREHLSSAFVQCKQVYATLPNHLYPPFPPTDHFPPFFFFFFWWNHWIFYS